MVCGERRLRSAPNECLKWKWNCNLARNECRSLSTMSKQLSRNSEKSLEPTLQILPHESRSTKHLPPQSQTDRIRRRKATKLSGKPISTTLNVILWKSEKRKTPLMKGNT